MVSKALLLTNYKFSEYAFSEVAGVPLFKRTILSGQKAGINEFFILNSSNKRSEIEASLNKDKRIRSKISIIDFSNHVKNGKEIFNSIINSFEDNYLIINGNVIFDHRLLREFLQLKFKDAVAALTVDKGKDFFPKKEFAQWYVKLSNNNVVGISQDMENCDGKATGIIIASPGITTILIEYTLSNLSSSLYKCIQSQIKDEKIMAVDIKDNLCIEVVSRQRLQEYERRLYNSLGTLVDGPIVDKYINRKISRIITKQLVKTPITPNQTTFLSLVIGVVAAGFFWLGGYWNCLAGGLVFQLSFIFDQCDGEIARLKFLESRIGCWFDAFCDSIIRTFIILGMTGSLYIEANQPLILILGILSSIGIFVSTMAGSYETFKKEKNIGYTNKKSTDASIEKENKLSAFIDKFNNTDSFSIILFICVLSGQLVWFLWTIGIGSFVFTLVILAKLLINKLASFSR